MDLREIALNKSKKRHPWELARIEVIKQFIRKQPGFNAKALNILDVGSGDIYLIKELAKELPNASFHAVDINYDADYILHTNKELQNQQIKISVYNQLAMAERNLEANVDLVLLLDVIEHVPDDVVFLQELVQSSKISAETLFLITVPAYQALFCSHDVFLGHYRRYNNQLLKQNVSKAGLQVKEIGYFFSFLLLPRYLQVAIEKRKRKDSNNEAKGIGNWEGGYLMSRLFKGILFMDFRLSNFVRKFGIKLPGLSNYAVCKKFV